MSGLAEVDDRDRTPYISREQLELETSKFDPFKQNANIRDD